MIHYHGSPLGGNNQDKVRFYHGRHALVPFSYPDDIGVVADVCKSFVLDNGAFTVWKKGEVFDFDGYYDFVKEWYLHPGFEWALAPDIIDGSEEENDELLERIPDDLKKYMVPVWHMHESLERFERLCNTNKCVAIGSSGEYPSPGAKVWWVRIADAMNKICDNQGRPPCKLHGLRMLNPKIFTKLPLSSADSTNAARKVCLNQNLFGTYKPPKGWQRAVVVADRAEAFNSAPAWSKSGFSYEGMLLDDFELV